MPQLRFKQDLVPGMEIRVHFTANKPGKYELACAELCGQLHFKMRSFMLVLPADEHQALMALPQDAVSNAHDGAVGEVSVADLLSSESRRSWIVDSSLTTRRSEMSGETHEAVHRHEAPTSFIRKYIFSLDHKVIGIQYILLALAAVLVGMTMSVLMRMNLSWPGTNWPILGTLFPAGAPGGMMTPEFYLSLVTMHGTIMVFFVLTTAPQGGFGNYFLPIQIGAEDMAFPVLNMLSFWVTLVGFIVILAAIFVAVQRDWPGRRRSTLDRLEDGPVMRR